MSDPLSCLCLEVRGAAQTLTRLYDRELESAGITVTQLSQLAAIRRMAGPTVGELAIELGLDRSTLGRNIRLLESLALVGLEQGQDARRKHLYLTKQGRATLRKAVPIWSGMQKKLKKRLGVEKRALLHELMSDLSSPELLEAKA